LRCSVVVVACCSVSVIPFPSGRSAAGSWPRSWGLFGSLHVLGCLLVRGFLRRLGRGLHHRSDRGGGRSHDRLVVLDRDLEDLLALVMTSPVEPAVESFPMALAEEALARLRTGLAAGSLVLHSP